MTLPYRGLSPELFHPETVFWNEKIASGELTQEEMEKLAILPALLGAGGWALRGLGSLGARIPGMLGGTAGKTTAEVVGSGAAGATGKNLAGNWLQRTGQSGVMKAHGMRADKVHAGATAAAGTHAGAGAAAFKPLEYAKYKQLPEAERLAYDKFMRVAKQNPALANKLHADAMAAQAGTTGMAGRAGTPFSWQGLAENPRAAEILNHVGFGKQMAQAVPGALAFTPFMIAPALMGDGGEGGLPQDDAQAVKMLQRRAAEEARYKRLMSQAQQHQNKVAMLKSKLTKKADLTAALQPGAPEMQRRDAITTENSQAADKQKQHAAAKAKLMSFLDSVPSEHTPNAVRYNVFARALGPQFADKLPGFMDVSPGIRTPLYTGPGDPEKGVLRLDVDRDMHREIGNYVRETGDVRGAVRMGVSKGLLSTAHAEELLRAASGQNAAIETPKTAPVEAPKAVPPTLREKMLSSPVEAPSAAGEGHTGASSFRKGTAAPPPGKMNPLAIASLGAAGGGALALGLPALISALSGSGKKKERF